MTEDNICLPQTDDKFQTMREKERERDRRKQRKSDTVVRRVTDGQTDEYINREERRVEK